VAKILGGVGRGGAPAESPKVPPPAEPAAESPSGPPPDPDGGVPVLPLKRPTGNGILDAPGGFIVLVRIGLVMVRDLGVIKDRVLDGRFVDVDLFFVLEDVPLEYFFDPGLHDGGLSQILGLYGGGWGGAELAMGDERGDPEEGEIQSCCDEAERSDA
jgi:hypothetical protein